MTVVPVFNHSHNHCIPTPGYHHGACVCVCVCVCQGGQVGAYVGASWARVGKLVGSVKPISSAVGVESASAGVDHSVPMTAVPMNAVQGRPEGHQEGHQEGLQEGQRGTSTGTTSPTTPLQHVPSSDNSTAANPPRERTATDELLEAADDEIADARVFRQSIAATSPSVEPVESNSAIS